MYPQNLSLFSETQKPLLIKIRDTNIHRVNKNQICIQIPRNS